jgi:beta-glucosidase
MKKLTALALLAALWLPALAAEPVKAPAKERLRSVTPDGKTAKWWTNRHAQKIAQRKKMDRVDLVFIGDSITHGWDNRGKVGEIWDKYYAKRLALNIGFSADRTEHVLWRLQHGAVDDIAPKLAVVMIGTNNAGHRREDPKHTALGIQVILTDLAKRLPKTKVLLLAIFPRGKDDNDALRKLNMATNKIIQTYADDKRVFFLDINAKFLDEKRVLSRSIMPDLLHPNAKGYQIWAEAMEPKIKELMGK